MLEGASPLNPIFIIKARRASDFIIYYFAVAHRRIKKAAK